MKADRITGVGPPAMRMPHADRVLVAAHDGRAGNDHNRRADGSLVEIETKTTHKGDSSRSAHLGC